MYQRSRARGRALFLRTGRRIAQVRVISALISAPARHAERARALRRDHRRALARLRPAQLCRQRAMVRAADDLTRRARPMRMMRRVRLLQLTHAVG
jgi:hypothetical protein